MKKNAILFFLMLFTFYVNAQISSFSIDGTTSVEITPFGIKSKNSQSSIGSFSSSNVALGPNALKIAFGTNNVAIGLNAMKVNIGDDNIAIGTNALSSFSLPGVRNIGIGTRVLEIASSSSTSDNIGIGYQSLSVLDFGIANVALGTLALDGLSSGSYNTAVGAYSMSLATSSARNTALGFATLGFKTNIGSNNTAIGYNSLRENSGSSNTSIGNTSLSLNNSGNENTAVGDSSLFNSITGSENVALGSKSLLKNAGGSYNTAIGKEALKANISGSYNSSVGIASLLSNISGTDNVAMGTSALRFNTAGDNNTALGVSALRNATTSQNTAVGRDAGRTLSSGTNGVFIGMDADVTSGSLSNSIAIGYNAKVNASNKAVIGNASVTTVGGYGSWTNYSDKRLKSNIVYDNKLGLDFILGLKTANYSYKGDQNQRKRDGFIAQDVEELLKKLKLEFSGLVIDNDKDRTLNLSYAEFVMPLVNAIQEQQEIIERQNRIISAMNVRILQIENHLINSNSASK